MFAIDFPGERIHKVRRNLFRVALSLGAAAILALLFYRIGPDNVLILFRQMGWRFFGVVLIFGMEEIVRAMALVECLSGHSRPSFRSLVHIRLIGEAVRAVTLTGPLLSEPTRAWLIRKQGVSTSGAVAATVAEYAANTFSSAVLTVAGVLYLLKHVETPKELRVAMMILLGGSVAYIGIVTVIVWRRRSHVTGGIAAAIVRPATLLRIAVFEFGAQFLLLVETYWALISMGVAVSLLTASLAEILTKVANVAFAGVAEGAYAVMFRALGLAAAAGFALSLVKRLRSLAFALIGLGILALVPGPLRGNT